MITILFTVFSAIVLVVLMVLLYSIYKLNTTDSNEQKYEKIVDGLVIAMFVGIGIVLLLANLMIFM